MDSRRNPDNNKRVRSFSSTSTPSPVARSSKKSKPHSDSLYITNYSSTMADTDTGFASPHHSQTGQNPGISNQLLSQTMVQSPQMVPMVQSPQMVPMMNYQQPSGSTLTNNDIKRIAIAVREILLPDIGNIVDKHIAPLFNRVSSLEAENAELRLKLDDLEQYGRRTLVRFSGFPENEREDTTSTVLDAATSCGVDLSVDDIERSHRVGKAGRGKPRQIIMRLKSVDSKFKLLKSSRNFRNESSFKGISVNEDLTRYRDELAFLARRLVRTKSILQTWTTNGKILVKDKSSRLHTIRTEHDLVPFGHVIDMPNDHPM
ncbi:uncharacterized protein LOC117320397 [Pecten maximus]|uniref:uncharacterized protein LOC117320397 n=1 Tax=Pecten maximus TaxID=6579 RepID=UPI0014581E59|nr:uncharacterized protein LOC117320397 [Pecten maximus]